MMLDEVLIWLARVTGILLGMFTYIVFEEILA